MPTSATGTSAIDRHLIGRRGPVRPPERGFTLLEILVVVLIIGIMSAGVLLSLNLSGRDPALKTAGRRLYTLMRYARDQAELQTRNYGIVFSPDGYAFVVFSPRRNLWRAVTEDDALRKRALPSGLSFKLVVDARPIALDRQHDPTDLTPQVMIFASGDLSSFVITLERANAGRSITIEENADGRIVEKPMVIKGT